MLNIQFYPDAWGDYLNYMQEKKLFAKINALIKDIARKTKCKVKINKKTNCNIFEPAKNGVYSSQMLVTDNNHVTTNEYKANYYYTIDPALAMSANFPFRERLLAREGDVVDITENPKGFYVTVEFDE